MSLGCRDETRLPSTTTGVSSRQMPPYFSTIGLMTSSGYSPARWNPVGWRPSATPEHATSSDPRQIDAMRPFWRLISRMNERMSSFSARIAGLFRSARHQHPGIVGRVGVTDRLAHVESADAREIRINLD